MRTLDWSGALGSRRGSCWTVIGDREWLLLRAPTAHAPKNHPTNGSPVFHLSPSLPLSPSLSPSSSLFLLLSLSLSLSRIPSWSHQHTIQRRPHERRVGWIEVIRWRDTYMLGIYREEGKGNVEEAVEKDARNRDSPIPSSPSVFFLLLS